MPSNIKRSISFALVLGMVSSCAHQPVSRVALPSGPAMPNIPVEDSSQASRTPNQESSDGDPWTTWSSKGSIGGLAVLSQIRSNILKNNLHDPHLGYFSYRPVDCSKTDLKARSADGTCNDVTNPHVGAAGVAFGRNISPDFIPTDAKEKLMLPNPSLVSKEFFTRDEFKPVPFLNMLAATWIQFMNHDWVSHGKNKSQNPHRINAPDGTVKTVEQTRDNDLNESQFKEKFGKISTNEITHWWDASQIYGSNIDEQKSLRSFQDGRMKVEVVNGREVLPRVQNFNPNDNKQNQGYEDTGFKDNWWVGLSLLHTLFVKEHNTVAEMLKRNHAKFDTKTNTWEWKNGSVITKMTASELDEKIFQTARLINAAVLAKIHTVEWTPAILPNRTLLIAMKTNWYGLMNPKTWADDSFSRFIPDIADWFKITKSGYVLGGIVGDKTNNFGVPYSMTEEFTSVYRLHSLLPEKLEFKKLATGSNEVVAVDFEETRNEKSYQFITNNDMKDMFYSFGTQNPGQLVLNNYPKFMQDLKIPGQENMDLGMVDILRDRERSVPRYNQFRRGISLKPIRTYKDFFPGGKAGTERQKKILEKFERVYGKDSAGNDNVEEIDLLVGTLAEEVRPQNFGFGETLFQIFILMASRRLMADRFYTTDYNSSVYTSSGMNWIDREGTLAKVILRHMPELREKLNGLDTAFQPWKN
jgi:hypothetical protein